MAFVKCDLCGTKFETLINQSSCPNCGMHYHRDGEHVRSFEGNHDDSKLHKAYDGGDIHKTHGNGDLSRVYEAKTEKPAKQWTVPKKEKKNSAVSGIVAVIIVVISMLLALADDEDETFESVDYSETIDYDDSYESASDDYEYDEDYNVYSSVDDYVEMMEEYNREKVTPLALATPFVVQGNTIQITEVRNVSDYDWNFSDELLAEISENQQDELGDEVDIYAISFVMNEGKEQPDGDGIMDQYEFYVDTYNDSYVYLVTNNGGYFSPILDSVFMNDVMPKDFDLYGDAFTCMGFYANKGVMYIAVPKGDAPLLCEIDVRNGDDWDMYYLPNVFFLN